MKNTELENIIKNDVNFFIEVAKCYDLNVTQVINLMDKHPLDFIDAYNLYLNHADTDSMQTILDHLGISEKILKYESEVSKKLDEVIDCNNIPQPEEVNNLADIERNKVRYFTENNGREPNKFNNKLFWLILLVFLFLLVTITLIAKSNNKHSNLIESNNVNSELIDEYHSHLSAYLQIRDSILDNIFYQYINTNKELHQQYNNLATNVIKSSFNGDDLLRIGWVEYCRNFDLLDLEYTDIENYIDNTNLIVDKFDTFTVYLASDVISDNLSFWYKDNGELTNNY